MSPFETAWNLLKTEGEVDEWGNISGHCPTCDKPHKLLIEDGAKINEFGECSHCEGHRDYQDLVAYANLVGDDYYPSGENIGQP